MTDVADRSTTPRRRWVRRLLLALVVLVAIGVVVSLSSNDPPAPPPEGPDPATAARATADGTAVDVSWTANTEPQRWKVLAFVDDRYVGQRTFAGSARAGRVEHLPPGTDITTWVVAANELGVWSPWVVTEPVALPPDPACATTDGVCVHVDAATPTGPASGVGLGFNHGVTAGTDPARVEELDVRHWRVSAMNEDSFRRARASGASVTVLVSDPWVHTTGSGDGAMLSPWLEWGVYEGFVRDLAQWHLDRDLLPERWDIQNEPSVRTFRLGDDVTVELLVEQHVRAAAAIRSVVPDAEVIGPSVSPPLFGHGVEDLEAFIAGAAAAGLDLDALAWHENMEYCNGCDGGPGAVRQHIDDARAALAAHGLGDLPIDITEFAGPYQQLQPGALVGFVTALAEGGVRHAGLACWFRADARGDQGNSCFFDPGTLGGLLLPDGDTPTDAWWTMRAYAELAGEGAQLARTTVDDGATSVVASVTGDSAVRSLIGRHGGCSDVDEPCPDTAPPSGDEDVSVRITPPAAGRWEVVVSRIASTEGAADPPEVVERTTVDAGGGPVTVGDYELADGEVLEVVATRR